MSQGAMLRVAVIGCGKVSQNMHLPALAKSSHAQLVAVCDQSREVAVAVGDRYSVSRVYDRVEDVLGDDSVDAVILAVGDPLHVPIARQALEAGKHVLVEKPLGVNAAECRALRETVTQSGCTLQVGLMKRHDPGLQYARQVVRELIGPAFSFSAWYRASEDRYVDESSVFLPVIRDPEYTRPAYKSDRRSYYLATHGVHVFDAIRFVVGAPTSINAILAQHGETFTWHGLLRTEGGAAGQFDLTVYVQGDWSEGMAVFGERGSLQVDLPNPFFLLPAKVRVFEAESASWRIPRFDQGDAYLRQLDAFGSSVLEGSPVSADVEDGIAAMEVLEAVEASVAAGGIEAKVGDG